MVDMAFAGILPYVISGKADMAISCVSITEERAKSVKFTDPYFVDPVAIGYRAIESGTADSAGFIETIKTAVRRNLIEENRWKMVVSGLGTTIAMSLMAQALGTALGCFLCWVLMRNNKYASGAGRVYSSLIHGLPGVVLLMISFYIIFGKTDIPGMLVAVCAFALVKAADVAENLKGAIDTVDKTEIEAARSIGFSAFGAFRTVTLPQAVKRALPGYCNGFVELVKSTAIVGYIAIADLTRAGDIIRSQTYDAYFPLLFVALIYLSVTSLLVWAFKLAVRKVSRA
jgi:polar amino acid transport system substrate-binding protein